MNSDDHKRYMQDSDLNSELASLFKQQYPSVKNCGDCELHLMQKRAADMVQRGLGTYNVAQLSRFVLDLSKTATDRG
jgi:hypothetical protein